MEADTELLNGTECARGGTGQGTRRCDVPEEAHDPGVRH